MVKLALYLALLASVLMLSNAPWIAALVYSIVSVMQPQYIWFWAFEGFSVFKFAAGVSILAWLWHVMQGNIRWEVYKTGQFKGMFLLLLIFYLSNFFTPFASYFSLVSGDLVVSIFTTIFIMYFIVLPLINNENTIKFFGFMYIFVVVYYAYWANDHYLSNNWGQFSQGRLMGPRGSPYADGNVTSIVLTSGLGFVMFGARYFSQKWLKYGLLFTIPFIWHALILFASRGALLSAAAVTLFFALVVKSRLLNIAIAFGFVGMLVWQGGMLTQRTNNTVAQAQMSGEEEPLNPRLVSWSVGIDIAMEYPLLGAGPQRFQFASRQLFPGKSPHVAHNTFLNFSANTGFFAGFIYLSFFWVSYKQYRFVKKRVRDNSIFDYINLSCMSGLVGYFVGAFFLDLIIFEPFYFLLLLISANYVLAKNSKNRDAILQYESDVKVFQNKSIINKNIR
ncbi:polymerase [Aestuariibacter sp. GS-14]|uniref:O-antigen ligase family protein n=1 Tax=Aestuariibacter sp. GS-14 TaxID=2590670 RepID=UPI0011287336|nr:O-antigen ligase family protein [Aestuariibacter sp. GS-14]TPV62111.1 polymerase [Aestuariibacter sp. GS-14]